MESTQLDDILERLEALESWETTATKRIATLESQTGTNATDIMNLKDSRDWIVQTIHGGYSGYGVKPNEIQRTGIIKNKEGLIYMPVAGGGQGFAYVYKGATLLLTEFDFDYVTNRDSRTSKDNPPPQLTYVGIGDGVIYKAKFTLQEDNENYAYEVAEYPILGMSLDGTALNITLQKEETTE